MVIYKIANIISEHEIAHFYLIGKLNKVFNSKTTLLEQIDLAFNVLNELVILHDIFQDGANICFDIDFSTAFSKVERFAVFLGKYPSYANFSLNTKFAITVTENGRMDFDSVMSINNKSINNNRELVSIIGEQSTGRVSLINYIILEELEEFLFYEFSEMAKLGLVVKKCNLCGKYFILKNKHNTLFCNRIYKDNFTCKQIGNKESYNNKVLKDSILKKYEKIYKANYAKMQRDEAKEMHGLNNGIARDKFKNWSKKAQHLRKEYLAKKISGDELILHITNK
ncbi:MULTISPECIES: DUF6076 domain-containing protein [unclassified Clostridioides]|uniref:DUF6076 domain-containing protein n=1 Tax=unclassified Clostridioides TaxID=2635829 RepID=UPI001D127AC6